MQQPFRLNAIASLFAAGAAALAASSHAADAVAPLAGVVVVSASRVEHNSFDLPASIDVIDAARIRDGQMRVNASEALSSVPGLVAQNRQNYAQDLQISSRGFGARSAFGVRGVRLISDGVPASMPDGQGQPSAFNLDMAERIEVLRGPFSAIYGNHSGGVIQLFTRDGRGRPTLELNQSGGSDGVRKTDMNVQGASGGVGYVIDASSFKTDGYRAHSAATRDQGFVKLTMAPAPGGKLTLVANSLQQGGTQDPLGVIWATYLRDPRAGEIDTNDTATPKRTFAERYDTRKNIRHQQIGVAYDQAFGDDRLHVMVYGGNRQVTQFQAFSKAFQAPATHSGGVVDFDLGVGVGQREGGDGARRRQPRRDVGQIGVLQPVRQACVTLDAGLGRGQRRDRLGRVAGGRIADVFDVATGTALFGNVEGAPEPGGRLSAELVRRRGSPEDTSPRSVAPDEGQFVWRACPSYRRRGGGHGCGRPVARVTRLA